MRVRELDPPQRKAWLHSALTPARTSTVLIRQYLDQRIAGDSKPERLACKAFLRAFHEAEGAVREHNVRAAGMRQFGIEPLPDPMLVACRGTEFQTVLVRVRGRDDLPTLQLPMTPALAHIIRETSANRVALDLSDDRTPPTADPDTPPRRGFPPKPEARLIPGRRAQ